MSTENNNESPGITTMYEVIKAAVKNSAIHPHFILFGFQSDIDKIKAANPTAIESGKAVTPDGTEVTFEYFCDPELRMLIAVCPGIASFELVSVTPQKPPQHRIQLVNPRR